MDIGEIVEIGERVVETPKITTPAPTRQPTREPERVKEPQREDA